MSSKLNWKKGIFSNTYKIFSGKSKVGELENKSFSQSADGFLDEKKFRFITKGFFTQKTQIIDVEKNVAVGKITYNTWKSKAIIEYFNEKYIWSYYNVWQTKWKITENDKLIINYKGSSTKGNIEFSNQNDLLILSGLFISNYYVQTMIAVMVAIFIPIFVS